VIVSIIVAVDKDGGIGSNNRLPWHISTDLRRFKKLTMSHHLIAGRKTFESIGRPLPGRTMIILTRNPDYSAEGCLVSHSLSEALSLAEDRGEDEVFIIGGGDIFQQSLDIVDCLYITYVQARVDADVCFPDIDLSEWKEVVVTSHDAGDADEYPSTFKKLIRKNNV
jgi:dihydrofolate reductase